MSDKPFIDTNVIIYSFATADRRSEAARAVVGGRGVISVQVLNEFVNVSRRKGAVSWNDLNQRVGYLKTVLAPILPITEAMHDSAREIAERYRIAFYDALVIAAAVAARCGVLYTEDLQHGAVIEGVTVRNPFSAS